MGVWGTTEVWQSVREWSTIVYVFIQIQSVWMHFLTSLVKIYISCTPDSSPLDYSHCISLLLPSHTSAYFWFPWIPLNMPRTQQKGITTRVSYPEGPTLEHRGMDHDIEPFSSIHSSEIWEPWRKNTAYKPNRHRICFQLKALVIFECFPMWFISYLIKSDGIYRRNVPIFLCCK